MHADEFLQRYKAGERDFRGIVLSGAELHAAKLGQSVMCRADLTYANLNCVDLAGSNLFAANLCRANLNGSCLRRVDLRWADLRSAQLMCADLKVANLSSATLACADMNRAQLALANLADANLRGADLHGADFTGANLCGADLRGAVLAGVNVTRADLTGAVLPRHFAREILWRTAMRGAGVAVRVAFADDRPLFAMLTILMAMFLLVMGGQITPAPALLLGLVFFGFAAILAAFVGFVVGASIGLRRISNCKHDSAA